MQLVQCLKSPCQNQMEQLIKPINEKTGEIMEETDFLKHFPITLIDIFRQTVEGVKVLHSKNIGTFEQ